MSTYSIGLSNVGSYQASGIPFCKNGAASPVSFPTVTRWIQIDNMTAAAVKVGFSANGVAGTNYILVPSSGSTGRLEVKCTAVYLGTTSANITVTAGLTGIGKLRIDNLTGSNLVGSDDIVGANWSGSSGVG